MDELVVFLMREFGWSLEYTVNLVQTLPIKKLNALVRELRYQKAMDDYKQAANAAMVVACLSSSKQRRRSAKDIIGQPPRRIDSKETTQLRKAAEEQNIKLPKE